MLMDDIHYYSAIIHDKVINEIEYINPIEVEDEIEERKQQNKEIIFTYEDGF